MKIFQVMVEDRHTDVEALPFTTADAAIEYARNLYKTEYAHPAYDNDDEIGELPPPDGWLYYVRCSHEGDSIWVIEQQLDGAKA